MGELHGGCQGLCQRQKRTPDHVSRVLADADITIRSLNTKVSKQGMATLEMMFEVSGRRQLKQLIEKIRQIESVIDVERSTG